MAVESMAPYEAAGLKTSAGRHVAAAPASRSSTYRTWMPSASDKWMASPKPRIEA